MRIPPPDRPTYLPALWADGGGDKDYGEKYMKLKWTQHARDVLSKRKIPTKWIDRTVDNPDLTRFDKVDPELKHHLKVIPEFGNRVLRVIVNTNVNPPRLITFILIEK